MLYPIPIAVLSHQNMNDEEDMKRIQSTSPKVSDVLNIFCMKVKGIKIIDFDQQRGSKQFLLFDVSKTE